MSAAYAIDESDEYIVLYAAKGADFSINPRYELILDSVYSRSSGSIVVVRM